MCRLPQGCTYTQHTQARTHSCIPKQRCGIIIGTLFVPRCLIQTCWATVAGKNFNVLGYQGPITHYCLKYQFYYNKIKSKWPARQKINKTNLPREAEANTKLPADTYWSSIHLACHNSRNVLSTSEVANGLSLFLLCSKPWVIHPV